MELAKFLCMRAMQISVLCTKYLQCIMFMAMRILMHTPVPLSLSARQASWQPTTLRGQSCCFSWLQWRVAFAWDILLSAAEGLWVDWRSLLCIQLLCCSLQKCFLSLCTPNVSGSSSSLCIWILFSVEDYSFYLSASPLKRIQEG